MSASSKSYHLSVPWDHVIPVCAEDIISSVNSDLWVSDFQGDEERGEFCLPVEWLHAQADTAINSADILLPTITLAQHKRQEKTMLYGEVSTFLIVSEEKKTTKKHFDQTLVKRQVHVTLILCSEVRQYQS